MSLVARHTAASCTVALPLKVLLPVHVLMHLMVMRRDWLDTSKEEHTKGRPLMCLACKGVLLLNAQSLRLHLASKRHSRLLKGFPQESVGPVCFATKARSASPGAGPLPRTRLRLESNVASISMCKLAVEDFNSCHGTAADAETHKERGARIAKEAAALQARPAILKVRCAFIPAIVK